MKRWLCLVALLGSACSSNDSSQDSSLPSDDLTGIDRGVVDRGKATERSTKPDGAVAPTLVEVTSFGSNPGKLRMYSLVPAGLSGPSPLVVVLHGCTQTAAVYAALSGWNDLAVSRKVLLVYAEQPSSNNATKCFNWFLPELASRDKGEAASIEQMVDKMRADHSVDDARIFVTGLSAGGAMTAALLADYPDVFAAGALMAGIPAGCATSYGEGLDCMAGVDRTPAAWGDLARAADPGHSGAWPRVVAFHGTKDQVVAYSNLQELADQWTNLHGAAATPTQTLTVKGQSVNVYKDGGGAEVVRTYTISGMSHGIAVDPGTGAEQGGTAGAYSYSVGLWSSYYAAEFFGL
jgi:poly(hydroxyalkanoate) depolymerase family esterase